MPTLNNGRELGRLISDIVEKLNNITEAKNVIEYYWSSGLYAEKLLKFCFDEEEISLPVDIRKVAEKLGIRIEEVNINDFSNENVKRLNHKIAQLSVQENIFTGKKEAVIYADKYIPPSSKRYGITNEIVQYIFHKEEKKIYENYFVMPMCPDKEDELITEIFSIFLLIPMKSFLNEFYEYVKYRIDEQEIPISTEEWIKYLAERAGVSEYYVAYGYQYLRSIAYWVYLAWQDEESDSMGTKERNEVRKWMPKKRFDQLKEWIFQNE